MGISTDGKMSGFRKWADPTSRRRLTTLARRRARAAATRLSMAAARTPPDRQPHRRRLVPGVGRL